MTHARKSRPPRKRQPEWLQDALRVAAQLMAVSLTAAVLHGVGVARLSRSARAVTAGRPWWQRTATMAG